MIDIEMINNIEEWGFDLIADYWFYKKYKLYHEDVLN